MDLRPATEQSSMPDMTRSTANPTAAHSAVVRRRTNPVYGFRVAHPLIYGLIAFMIGSSAIAIFTMTTYTNWEYESIDLKVAIYQVVLGGLGGGLAMVMLAFAYARSAQQTSM